jgi:hypothetical protein
VSGHDEQREQSHSSDRHLALTCVTIVLVPCILACVVMVLISGIRTRKLAKVESCAQAVVSELPEIQGCEVIAQVPELFTHGRFPDLCYYGRVGVVIGTSLPVEEAQARHFAEMREAGWQVLRENPAIDWLIFARDEDKTAYIDIGGLGPIITGSEAYKSADKGHESEFLVSVQCMLPSIDACY